MGKPLLLQRNNLFGFYFKFIFKQILNSFPLIADVVQRRLECSFPKHVKWNDRCRCESCHRHYEPKMHFTK